MKTCGKCGAQIPDESLFCPACGERQKSEAPPKSNMPGMRTFGRIQTNILTPTEVRKMTEQKGCYTIMEYARDISVDPADAAIAYFASQMNIRKRQVVAELDGTGVIVQAGEMQLMLGNIEASTNISGAGDFFKKLAGSMVTGESAIKPHYHGYGVLVLEPSYDHILIEDLADWNGTMVIDDGMFLACDDTVQMKITRRHNFSSALLGGKGLFNTELRGHGNVVLESRVPREELIAVELYNDVLKVDGNMAIAWSDTLSFTVEKVTKTLIGSAASGEGLVNVYRGTGRVLIAPVAETEDVSTSTAARLGNFVKRISE